MIKHDFALLVRLLVKPFYRENAGLIVVVYFICFGFFQGVNAALEVHRNIMHDVCSVPWAFWATCFLWSGYYLKSMALVIRELREQKNECLYVLGIGNIWNTLFPFLLLQILLSLPVSAYAFFTSSIGFQSGFYSSAICLALVNVVFIVGSSALYTYIVRNAHNRMDLPVYFSFKLPISIPYSLFFGLDLVQNRKLSLFVCKSVSLFLLWGGFYLMKVQGFDIRFGLMAMVASVATHVVLLQKLRDMEDESMAWMGNLPISSLARFGGYLLFFCFMLLPELFLVLKCISGLIKWYETFLFLGIGVAGLSYFHSLLFKKGMDPDKFMNQVFASWAIFTCSIQFKVPVVGVICVLLAVSFWQYRSRYYFYETAKGK